VVAYIPTNRFDVRITYDKNRQALDFAATITSELMPNEHDRPEGRSRVSDIAGAVCGFGT
jgi:hypothetical protein